MVNPKEDDIKFLDKIEQLFEGMGRLAYELPLYKVYKNNLYHFYKDALKVIFRKSLEVLPQGCNYTLLLQGTYEHSSKYANKLQEKLERGESSKVQGMLEQWLREKKLSTEEAVTTSATMFTAGIHTVTVDTWV